MMHVGVSAFLLTWSTAYLWLVSRAFFGDREAALGRLVAEGRIKADYADYILNVPTWVVAASVVLALVRVTASVALLWRSSLATPLWVGALTLTLVIMFRGFVLANAAAVIRPTQVAVEIGFVVISVLAVVYAWRLQSLG